MRGRTSDPEMVNNLPRVRRNRESHHSWIVQLIRGFHAVWGGINPGDHFFFLGMLKFYMCGSISDPDMTPDLPRVALAQRGPAHPRYANGVGVSIPCWAIDPGNHRFRARFIVSLDVWKGFRSGWLSISSAGAAKLHASHH